MNDISETFIDRGRVNEEHAIDVYKKKIDTNNPNRELYAASEDGYKLKPRQCPGCHKIFEPDYDIQEKCEDCSDVKKS